MLDKKAVFINTASQVVVRFITLAFALVAIKLLTNYLGTTGVGEFNTIVAYINLFLLGYSERNCKES
jgi:O-antigen/teichoic acid export membrane protein